jgi:hypothetical protein
MTVRRKSIHISLQQSQRDSPKSNWTAQRKPARRGEEHTTHPAKRGNKQGEQGNSTLNKEKQGGESTQHTPRKGSLGRNAAPLLMAREGIAKMASTTQAVHKTQHKSQKFMTTPKNPRLDTTAPAGSQQKRRRELQAQPTPWHRLFYSNLLPPTHSCWTTVPAVLPNPWLCACL